MTHDPLPNLRITGTPVYTPPASGSQPITCPSTGTVVDGSALLLAVQDLAAQVNQIEPDSLTCSEVDRLAAVLAYGGYELAAATLVIGHAQDDEIGDHEGHQVLRMHYETTLGEDPEAGAQSMLDAALEFIRTTL